MKINLHQDIVKIKKKEMEQAPIKVNVSQAPRPKEVSPEIPKMPKKKTGSKSKSLWDNTFSVEVFEGDGFVFSWTMDDLRTFLKETIPDIEEDPSSQVCHFYSPSFQIGIFLVGIRKDSSFYSTDHKQKRRTVAAEEKGIRLIQIFEDEWAYKKDIVKAKLSAIFKIKNRKTIGARKGTIMEINSKDTQAFLEANHIQGYIPASYRLGLFYNDEIIAIMTFRRVRGVLDLSRYATKLGLSIPGGFKKLLTYAVNNLENSDIVSTFADLRWSKLENSIYEANGFNFQYYTAPNYHYYHEKNSYQKMSRNRFQKHKLKEVLPIFDATKSEAENMYDNGYIKVTDCGNLKFILNTLKQK